VSRALVVGDGSAAYVLPALRSLGRAGWTLGVGQPAPGSGTTSRWCSAYHPVPRAEDDEQRWLDAVVQAVRAGSYDVVFPADDIELLALSAHRDRVPALVPYPAHAAVVAAVDKLTLTRAAERVGMGTPRTLDATDDAVAASTAPVVVKARLHWSPGDRAPDRHLPVQIATGPDAVRAAVAAVRAGGGEPVLQEVLDGTLMAVSAVADRSGTLVAYSQQETTRQTLRRTSARAHTVAADPGLEDCVRALLRELGWWGIANLQFLRGADGVPRLIDLNARFYGSLALAVRAGADLPRAWADVALGGSVAPALRCRPGVRFQALDEDLLAVRAGDGVLAGAAGALAHGLGATHSVWDRHDPGPLVQRLAQRVARRLRG